MLKSCSQISLVLWNGDNWLRKEQKTKQPFGGGIGFMSMCQFLCVLVCALIGMRETQKWQHSTYCFCYLACEPELLSG
jgi:hypothetical protein